MPNILVQKIQYGSSRISKSISIGAQWSKEKLGMAKPSTFDADFLITEKTYKALEQLLNDLVKYIVIYLQPKSKNQKHLVIETMSYTNILRKERVTQFEENLAEMLLKNAHANGIDNVLGMALQRTGDVFHSVAKIKTERDYLIKSRFLGPLTTEIRTEVKELNHQRDKLERKRREYDACAHKSSENAKKIAQKKLDISTEDVALRMKNFIEANRKRVFELLTLINVLREYQLEYGRLLKPLGDQVATAMQGAGLELPEEIKLSPVHTFHDTLNITHDSIEVAKQTGSGRFIPSMPKSPKKDDKKSQLGQNNLTAKSIVSRPGSAEVIRHEYTTRLDDSFSTQDSILPDQPLCIALYDFEAENYGELTIVEGQKVELLSQPDNEWFEGRVDGKIGFFPIRYVRVIVPLK